MYTSRLNEASSTGRTTLYLETEEPPMTPEEVMEAAKEGLPQIVGSQIYIGWDGGRDNLQIRLTLRGESTDTLARLGKQVTKGVEPGSWEFSVLIRNSKTRVHARNTTGHQSRCRVEVRFIGYDHWIHGRLSTSSQLPSPNSRLMTTIST